MRTPARGATLTSLVALAALCGVASTATAQECDLDAGDLAAYAIKHRAFALGLDAEPLLSPASSQVAAPASPSSDDPVPDASFPALVALNLGIPTTSSDNGAITFNLTPFALVAARNPEVIDNQSQYMKYESMRRIGAALTLGGKGEAFDRNGDGVVDDALQAESWSDITSFEVRYRLFGSRDRRDAVNHQRYFAAMNPFFANAASGFAAIAARLAPAAIALPPQADGKYCPSDAEKLAQDQAALIDSGIGAMQAINQYLNARRDVLQAIDEASIWTVVAGVTEQKEEFGPDRWWLGIRGAGGLGPDQGWTASLDFGETDSTAISTGANLSNARRIKAGLEWAALIAKRWVAREQGGIRASLSGAYEKWQDVPGVGDDEVASLNFKLRYPITDTISIPLSITWANKTSLLQDESEVRGYIGFTFDFDGALSQALTMGQ